ncbi:MAG: MFS transporter [bacterium]
MNELIQKKALTFSIIDGALSSIMGSLAGGIFLTGFALKVLHAQPQQIGVLAALPLFANFIQLFGSYIIEKTGRKKELCFFSVVIGRMLWILIIMLPFKIFAPVGDFRIWVLVIVIAISSLFSSLSGVAWLAWMSDLVPENMRGSYFGKRNMIASACGMLAILAGGKFLTLWGNRFTESSPFGFVIIFIGGLIAGLIAVWFINNIPEVSAGNKVKNSRFELKTFLNPFKDKNFLNLIIFVSAWMFGIQLAAPFYGVFMIENLNINFSTITVFGAIATCATLFMMKIWGPISDTLGNKPIIIVSGWVLIIVPFVWIAALPGKYYAPVLMAHILSGAFMAGAALSQFNILIKLSPQDGRSVYLALFSAITGLIGASAPIIGGGISKMLEGVSFTFFTYNISNLQIIFIISSFIQLATIFFILKVKEPRASTPVAVIMQLKNDLNPQTGIAGAADFMMVEIQRSENILKQIDNVTEVMASSSERQVEKIINRLGQIFNKFTKKIKKLLKRNTD